MGWKGKRGRAGANAPRCMQRGMWKRIPGETRAGQLANKYACKLYLIQSK